MVEIKDAFFNVYNAFGTGPTLVLNIIKIQNLGFIL